ncbi:hypothetical protein A3A03_01630 [Candidatus Nomurabacteria bacterium RIFCSPLOWO2_01_FULL_40_18]|uniref:Endolytic murein transglycosylase n=1 Tax=Candidatus Nomurabacteria bacterium RIFCSPLOWO2_01_FULL_40_18 TaxID=1801773 RepID=A0A1F6XKL3_9BACT|nr:MAG: hypothetical protein A3A03_01630 [Candidatus Nomurabacteria bacterium RIFCSPLOWO2_01_FULL_40_18]
MQNKKIFCILFIIVFLCILFFFFISAPGNFPTGIIFQIAPGNSLRSVSSGLKEDHIIRSRLTFETLVMLFSGEKRVISADYYFENKLSVLEVAWRISKGEHHMAPIAFTIPEGYNNTQIADIFVSKLSNFDKNEFLLKTQGLEGRLFPDTYFFFTTASEKEVLESIRKNFEKKMSLIRADILNSKKTTGRTEQDIIIMASLIEGEAKGDIDRKVISGILWKRLSIGMPLQADAAPETYKTKGLPKIPIGNPGLEALKATIYPQSSPYLYYLHDKNGDIHYAKSFLEHRQNVLKYLQ